MDLKKSFAERLHNARLMRGLSMQQLCDMMGNIITKQTLFKYEKGVMLPKSGIVIALCDALEITPDYLNMKKIILFLLAILYVGICKAQLSAADYKYVLEIFCRNYYGSCFDGKTYVPNTIIITSVGIARIAVEPLCPGFIPTKDSIFRFGGTCSTVKVGGRPGRDSLPTNRIIIKNYENWCFLASIVAVFLFFALSIKEFGNAMQHFNGNRHLS